ncbi:glycoside hydrolase family 25 protein [Pedobacter insulae]|uniref:Lysozyme n=1 Tax=Pedobacter insulae TaxID=414048 RepID=A0A1I2UER7_9SPHI|nr:glycoside hydrolase family 25 protein [Pedobacter insulae]SFG75672.1 lysozyme [Pedobacter insulae]
MPVRKRKPSRKKSKGLSLQLKFAIASILLVLLSPFYYGYVLKIASSAWFWLRHPDDDKNYRTYESYEIKIPKKYTIHGIDVSYYQGKIDWQKVSAMEDDGVKIDFAFIKATEGILSVDPYFQRNWREAPKSGIKVGAYHFFRPQKSGLWQANFFLQTITIEKGDLPPVVDVESLDGVSPEKMRKELNAFVVRVEERAKVRPIIYTGLTFYQRYLEKYYPHHPFWVAHYHQPKLKLEDKAWKFWQHSDKARINGINHVVDFNAFNGDSLQFQQMFIP